MWQTDRQMSQKCELYSAILGLDWCKSIYFSRRNAQTTIFTFFFLSDLDLWPQICSPSYSYQMSCLHEIWSFYTAFRFRVNRRHETHRPTDGRTDGLGATLYAASSEGPHNSIDQTRNKPYETIARISPIGLQSNSDTRTRSLYIICLPIQN